MASLDTLFPAPQPPPSALAPERWPGISPESTDALLRTLQDNHAKWHCFFNDKGFHNHTAHHLLAAYALGADAPLLEAAYASNAKEQKKAYASPAPIDAANFRAHLGDGDYYAAYLAFFSAALAHDGIPTTLEKHVFSPEANLAPGEGKVQPLMLIRLLEGLLHPLIHAGCGAEFGLPGVVAEGLALAAVHPAKSFALMPPSLFGTPTTTAAAAGSATGTATRGLSRLFSALSPFGALAPNSSAEAQQPLPVDPPTSNTGPHALQILAKLLRDPAEAPHHPADDADKDLLDPVLLHDEKREHLRALAEEWARGVDLTAPGALAAKLEEIVWMNVLMYAVGGWTPPSKDSKDGAGEFKADFFLMHLVTSSLFLPSLAAHLTAASQRRLLVAYFASVLAAYVARGRPALALHAYFARPAPPLSPPGPHPTPHQSALHPARPARTTSTSAGHPDSTMAEDEDDDAKGRAAELHPNAWLPVAQSALFHPEAHVTKCVRALAHHARAYGSGVRPGHFARFAAEGGEDPLVGAEAIDGSLFVRAAAMTMGRVGWTREGEEARFWDRLSV